MDSKTIAIVAVVIAAALFLGVFTPGGLIYQRNADTLITTGTMNIGVPKDLYLSSADYKDIPVEGNVFANASGFLRVEVNPNNKFCSYVMVKETGFFTPWEVYHASTLTNDIKYSIRITQPNGVVTSKNDVSPFDMSNLQMQLPFNPDRPNKAVYVQFNGQQASLGESSCDDRNSFVVLRYGSSTVAVNRGAYETRITNLNWLALLDLWNIFNSPTSQFRYSKPLDVSQITGLTTQYYEPRLGDANVQVSAPFWAYKTIIFEKTPDGRARVDSCTISKAAQGQQTYMNLIFTNVGDTSKFFYLFSSSDYSVPTGSNSGGQIQSESQRQEVVPISVVKIGQLTATVKIRGESGIETTAICNGEGVSGGILPPPPPPPPPPNQTAKQCIPIIQHPVVQEVGGNYFDLVFTKIYLGGTTQVQNCETDYVGLIILGAVALGLIMVLRGRR